MKLFLLGADEAVGRWVLGQQGSEWTPGRGRCIGVVEGQKILAGIVYEGWNGSSVWMHIAAIPGSGWLTRSYIALFFDYPFNQLGVRKVLAPIGSGNAKSIALVEGLGFRLEATLSEAHPDGALLLYSMHKDQCSWLTLAEKEPWKGRIVRPRKQANVQAESTSST